jgi:hypothetical protein
MAALPTPPNNTPTKSHRRGYSLMVTFLLGVKDFDEMGMLKKTASGVLALAGRTFLTIPVGC